MKVWLSLIRLTALQAVRKAYALDLTNVTFSVADAEPKSQISLNFIDRIICCSCILFMEDVDGALKRFAGWLVRDGSLCFNTPEVFA